jgi:hypothetical protein
MRSTSNWRASVSASTSRVSGRAPCVITRLASRLRLVISTTQLAPPGSSGVTCAAS